MAEQKRAASDPRRLLAQYVLAAGRVVNAWNKLHQELCEIFLAVTKLSRMMGRSIWYSIQSDAQQRRILRAAVASKSEDEWPITHPKTKQDIFELIDYVDKLSASRNDAIHIPIGVASDDGELWDLFAFLTPRSKRLNGKEIVAEFRRCANEATELIAYSRDIAATLIHVFQPWPNKPASLHPQAELFEKTTPRPQSRKERRRTQPRSSRS